MFQLQGDCTLHTPRGGVYAGVLRVSVHFLRQQLRQKVTLLHCYCDILVETVTFITMLKPVKIITVNLPDLIWKHWPFSHEKSHYEKLL